MENWYLGYHSRVSYLYLVYLLWYKWFKHSFKAVLLQTGCCRFHHHPCDIPGIPGRRGCAMAVLQADGKANPRGLGTERGAEHVGVWAPRWCWGAHFGQAFPNLLASHFFVGDLIFGCCRQVGAVRAPAAACSSQRAWLHPKTSLPVQVVSEWLARWAEQGERFPPPRHLVFGQAALASSGPAASGELGTPSTPHCPAGRAQHRSCDGRMGLLLGTHGEFIPLLENVPPTLNASVLAV